MNTKQAQRNDSPRGEHAQSPKATNRTPGPWHVGLRQAEKIIYDKSGWAIANCTVYHNHGDTEPTDNSNFIVRACNAHDDLLAVAKGVAFVFSEYKVGTIGGGLCKLARAAIAKAEA
jgi:hypothetical protein